MGPYWRLNKKDTIKGKKPHHVTSVTIKAEDYGYFALCISIVEELPPDQSFNVLYNRIHNKT